MVFSNFIKKKTKIIATFGPACDDKKVLSDMIQSGLDLIRINMSHNSDLDKVRHIVDLVRTCSDEQNKPVGIMMDLQGPKIRVGKFKNGSVDLKSGDTFTFFQEQKFGNELGCSISYSKFVDDVEIGHMVFVDDGKLQFKVINKHKDRVECEVISGGPISDKKGVNLPQTNLQVPALTEKDLRDVRLAVECKVDYVALSFVSTAIDVLNLRNILDELKSESIFIISKIERQVAMDNLVSIIDASDAVMVARGDLGVEIGVQNVPKQQKRIIRMANRKIKPVIVATQMLDSMVKLPIATRAEVSDVANAIYDRCDAVMLSQETAIGNDPVNVIKVMSDICLATDGHMIDIKKEDRPLNDYFEEKTRSSTFCVAADQIGAENNAIAIMTFTSSGNTPLLSSKLNSVFYILAPTDEKQICQRMSLYRGVFPFLMEKKFRSINRWTDMINSAVRQAKKLELLQKGDAIVVTAGRYMGVSGSVNSIRLVDVY